jgi:hypothetical protein
MPSINSIASTLLLLASTFVWPILAEGIAPTSNNNGTNPVPPPLFPDDIWVPKYHPAEDAQTFPWLIFGLSFGGSMLFSVVIILVGWKLYICYKNRTSQVLPNLILPTYVEMMEA